MDNTTRKFDADADFDQLPWLYQNFPRVRNPLPLGPPPPWIRAQDAQQYRRLQRNTNPTAHFRFWRRMWKQLQRSAPLIREPASDRRGLIQCDLVGHCLDPIFPVGTRCWFDPNVRAQHGDFVMFEMDPALIDLLSKDPIALRENGGAPKTNVMIKRLMWLDNWFLISKNSGGPIGSEPPHRHRVLGVLRDFELGAARGDAPAGHGAFMQIIPRGSDTILNEASGQVSTVQIGDEAVTTIASAEDESGSLANGGGVVLQIFQLPTIGIDYTLVVTASLNVWISDFGSGAFQDPVFFLSVDGAQASQSTQVSATTAPGERITLQVEVDISAADEPVGCFIGWSGLQPNGEAEYRAASLRCEAIKR